MNIFKAYDIRGKYPAEIDEKVAEKIGLATAKFIRGKTIAIGRDVRKSAPAIAEAVANGITKTGVDVIDIGLSTTPMLYFTVGRYGYDGGIMITASHNPPDYIGFKVCRENAIPIGESNGLKIIETMTQDLKNKDTSKKGIVSKRDVLADYKNHILGFVKNTRKMRIVVDTANGSVGKFFTQIFSQLPLEIIPLCFEPDGSFPNHEPNPLKDENIIDSSQKVKDVKADFGVAFDGDGDRCIFMDEKGSRISSDLITVLLAKEALATNKGRCIVYDLRSSRVVREEIEKAGGKPIRDRVGHAFIKQTMRKHNALLGGELSGHYYFKENYFCDSALVAFAKVISYLSADDRKMSEIIAPLNRYYATGEMNFHSDDKDGTIKHISDTFSDGRQDMLDGITVEFDDWWFNLRKSNTEPLLRLNLEASTSKVLDEAKKKLFNILGEPV